MRQGGTGLLVQWYCCACASFRDLDARIQDEHQLYVYRACAQRRARLLAAHSCLGVSQVLGTRIAPMQHRPNARIISMTTPITRPMKKYTCV